MLTPPLLKTGDTVAITAPAGKITENEIHHAVNILESWGLKVIVGKTIGTSYFKYADTDKNRIKDVQHFLDHEDVTAIFFARGGYGSIRIIDKLDFTSFQKKPKWIIGYSDITIFHTYLNSVLNIPSIHGPMPKTFNDEASNNYLKSLLFEGQLSYTFSDAKYFKEGKTNSKIIGGNLAILQSNLGSKSDILPSGNILFLEDIDIYLYELDRMLWSLKRAGKLETLSGIVVGDFSNMKDNVDPFGKDVTGILSEHFEKLNIPIFIGFPGGHERKNFPLLFNLPVSFSVAENEINFVLKV